MLRESATGLDGDGDPAPEPLVARRASCSTPAASNLGTAVLLGPPGTGKSDLALRLIDGGARLVSDDRLAVERKGDVLIGRAIDSIAGLIEVRGLGIMRIGHCASSRLGLVVALGGAAPPRLPERMTYELLGVALPYLELDPVPPPPAPRSGWRSRRSGSSEPAHGSDRPGDRNVRRWPDHGAQGVGGSGFRGCRQSAGHTARQLGAAGRPAGSRPRHRHRLPDARLQPQPICSSRSPPSGAGWRPTRSSCSGLRG